MDNRSIISKLAVALVLATGCPVALGAQEYVSTPVTLSKDKVRVNGEVCWSHVVLERQTLFSISKAYGVSIDEIYRVNPSLKETGLKKNAIVLIPVQSDDDASKIRQDREKRQAALDSLTSAAPSVRPKKSGKQTIHVSKWYEDLNSIAEKYGVTPEAIMKANNMTGTKLSNRQKLVIPDNDSIEESIAEIPEKTEADPVIQDTISVIAEEQAMPERQEEVTAFVPKDKVTATLLLPMKTADGMINRNNMDFYSGALLAVYDLAEKGISTDLSVFDITDGSNPVGQEYITESDVIIGPVSNSDISRLLNSFPPTTMVISPLDPRAEDLVAGNSNLIQAPTPHKMQYTDLTEWVKEDLMPGDTVLVISEKAYKQSDAAKLMMEVIDSSGISCNYFSYNILEGRDVINPLKKLMTDKGTNRVMIASESEAFVNDVIRNMNLMLYEQYKVVLYAPSKFRSFDTIEVEHFHKTNMHCSLTYYIDYDDQRVKDFLLKYRALYNAEPSQFAFQGYDIASYFINLCSRYGDRWSEMADKAPQAMLQSTFRCVKDNEDGGYVNNGIRRIVYGDNWSVYEMK